MTPHNLMSADQIALCRRRFSGPRLSMVLDAIEAGNALAQLWDVPLGGGEPALALWDRGNNVLYLTGDADDDASVRTLAGVLEAEVLAAARAGEVRRVKLCPLSASLRTNVARLVPTLELQERRYLFHAHAPTLMPEGMDALPPGVRLVPITPQVLDERTYRGSDAVREEIRAMWPSEERFHEHGFGVLAIQGEEIVCWCTAEYVGSARCGIGIETRSDMERRGIATAATVLFLQAAEWRGLEACWECDAQNIPSVRVAQKTCFTQQAEETYWIAALRSREE